MGFGMADKNIVWRKKSLSTNDAGYHDKMWYLDNKIPQTEQCTKTPEIFLKDLKAKKFKMKVSACMIVKIQLFLQDGA